MDVSQLLNADPTPVLSPDKEQIFHGWVLPGQGQDMDIDIKHEEALQPPASIKEYDYSYGQGDSDRRSSTSSLTLPSTASSPSCPKAGSSAHRVAHRRLSMHCGHMQPYPTPGSTPVPDRAASEPQHKKRRQSRKREEVTDPVERAKMEEKADRENKQRDILAVFLSLLERDLQRLNPDFAKVATGFQGEGWKPLKKNNISDKKELKKENTGVDPSSYNKRDLLATTQDCINQFPQWAAVMLKICYALSPEVARKSEDVWKKMATPQFDQALEQLQQLAKLLGPGHARTLKL
ncbi:hypothetical protein K491DRAFT_242116 [Lophiostoma macrostomum CBS 122681]|uniref:Uncharacterized protein n=1 Tax=Lophiostoma macrostomum CBS 122681 TaxID=1314788 RepID=A0A6A6SKS5_9PLEO|nr:hypothetical protein K491DRAFT_242116 [Lophiostoma macrostomum CBS 122681]